MEERGGKLLSDRWDSLELATLPSAHAGIRRCDKLKSYKIEEWASEITGAGSL